MNTLRTSRIESHMYGHELVPNGLYRKWIPSERNIQPYWKWDQIVKNTRKIPLIFMAISKYSIIISTHKFCITTLRFYLKPPGGVLLRSNLTKVLLQGWHFCMTWLNPRCDTFCVLELSASHDTRFEPKQPVFCETSGLQDVWLALQKHERKNRFMFLIGSIPFGEGSKYSYDRVWPPPFWRGKQLFLNVTLTLTLTAAIHGDFSSMLRRWQCFSH